MHGLAISSAIRAIYLPYKSGFALRISRYGADRLIPLSDSGATMTLAFNIGLVAFLLLGGAYLALLVWRKGASKP